MNRYRLAPSATWQVAAGGVDVFARGRTTRLPMPKFRLILEFSEPRTFGDVFALVRGVSRAEFDAYCERLVVAGILQIVDERPPPPADPLRSLLREGLFDDEDLVRRIRAQLESGRAVVVEDAFRADLAERVHADLSAASWKLREVYGPQFYYHHHNLYSEEEFPESVRECRGAFDHPDTRAFVGTLSGRDCSGRALVGASLYLPGDHSLPHRDHGSNRQVAFVWHLTKDWESGWGGAFYWCPTGTIVRPQWNALVLFDVSPSSFHLVTMVTPYAQGRRLAVSGWWTSAEALQEDETRAESSPISESYYGLPQEKLTDDGRIRAI